MELCEKLKLIPIFNSANITAGADGDSFCIKHASHVALLCMFGPSLSNDAVLKVYSGAADGEKTAAITFAYRYGGAATGSASADVLTARATSAALTCTGTTFVSRLLVIDIDPRDLTDGHYWITVNVSNAADAGELTIIAAVDAKYMDPSLDTYL